MIKLTDNETTKAVYINQDAVKGFSEVGVYDGSIIKFLDGTTVEVHESLEEIYCLITKYKQRQMRLQAAYNVLYNDYTYTIVDKVVALESEDRGE